MVSFLKDYFFLEWTFLNVNVSKYFVMLKLYKMFVSAVVLHSALNLSVFN